jgi:3-hydroxyisobutyrate dehydrogenase-like beta-hydroxyacid dehydrogenase
MTQVQIDAVAPGRLHIAQLGYGEVGSIVGRALHALGPASLRSYDRLFDDGERKGATWQRSIDDGVEPALSAVAAVAGADLVICAVTADQTLAAAKSVSDALRPGAFYVDLNSASPQTKRGCAAMIDGAGARYVEMAVMASVPPSGIRVPMLSGGPHATAAAPLLAALGFRVEQASEQYGVASAIKMCRSVVVKGMEAIVIESFLAARRYGIENEVLATLAQTFPGIDWEKNGSYFFQRVIQHGRRRAEEMREAAVSVREVGLEPLMTNAIVARQAWVADLARSGAFGEAPGSLAWRDLADRILIDDKVALDAHDDPALAESERLAVDRPSSGVTARDPW